MWVQGNVGQGNVGQGNVGQGNVGQGNVGQGNVGCVRSSAFGIGIGFQAARRHLNPATTSLNVSDSRSFTSPKPPCVSQNTATSSRANNDHTSAMRT